MSFLKGSMLSNTLEHSQPPLPNTGSEEGSLLYPVAQYTPQDI